MKTTISADGTTLAFRTVGEGRTVVIVSGALSTAADAMPLAEGLSAVGLQAVVWDRRGRGGSGDRPGSGPEQEAQDLAAVIAAVGGASGVLGHSSGALLALFAAHRGVDTGHLFLSEPPLDFDGSGFDEELSRRLRGLVADGEGAQAVAVFQRDAVGLPPEMVEAALASGQLDALAPLGASTVHDVDLTLALRRPAPELLAVGVPVTVLRGERTFPFLVSSSERAAAELHGAELVVVPDSVMHRPDPAATAAVVAARL